jgi:hypothetical protein
MPRPYSRQDMSKKFSDDISFGHVIGSNRSVLAFEPFHSMFIAVNILFKGNMVSRHYPGAPGEPKDHFDDISAVM